MYLKNTNFFGWLLSIIVTVSLISAQSHFNVDIGETGRWQYFIFSSSITSLDIGDEIGIFDFNGIINYGDCLDVRDTLLVGAGVWAGDQLTISAISSLNTCEYESGWQAPGFVDGDEIVIRIWDVSEGLEYESSAMYSQGDGQFIGDGDLAIIAEIVLCDVDECGVCGGDGIAEGACDCAGNVLDCIGICGGTAEIDICGICGGDGTACLDCNGDLNGSAVIDECGVCGGDGIAEGACDCIGNVSDCSGICGGDSVADKCGNCNGVCNGVDGQECGQYDCFGNCVTGSDCFGICGGTAVIDICGNCGGDGSNCTQGCMDETACNYNPDATEGNNSCTYPPEDYDCDGNCILEVDCFGMCGGGAHQDIIEQCCSQMEVDICDVCNGDDSTCKGCTFEGALNFDPDALYEDGSCIFFIYGCMDSTALNYDSTATNSDGSCDYPPLVRFFIDNIDSEANTLDIWYSSQDTITSYNFSITGIEISGVENNIIAGGALAPHDEAFLLESFSFEILTDLTSICLQVEADDISVANYNEINLKIGGCASVIGVGGGIIESDIAIVDIPEGALAGVETIAVGQVTEELPESIENQTGFDLGELVSFTPYNVVFNTPVTLSLSTEGLPKVRGETTICYSYDSNSDQLETFTVTCDNPCDFQVERTGVYTLCIPQNDCNGDLGGHAFIDNCGKCVGGQTGYSVIDPNTSATYGCADINGDPTSPCMAGYAMDECGLCNGPGYITWYQDLDDDGLGDPNMTSSIEACADFISSGYVSNNLDNQPNCSTNNEDACQVCNGEGPDEGYACDGNCIATDNNLDENGLDCEGVCGGGAVEDACQVCNGDGPDEGYGCDGNCIATDNNLDGNGLDCAGVCGGSATQDTCGICKGDVTDVAACGSDCTETGENLNQYGLDCNGTCGGDAEEGECGVCNGSGPAENYNCSGECTAGVDCNGLCGGDAVEDECGVCNGSGPAENYNCSGECIDQKIFYRDADGDGLGSLDSYILLCSNPGTGWVENSVDVNDSCFSNVTDECEVCDGTGEISMWPDDDYDGLGAGNPIYVCPQAAPDAAIGGYVYNNLDWEPSCSTNDPDLCDECAGDNSCIPYLESSTLPILPLNDILPLKSDLYQMKFNVPINHVSWMIGLEITSRFYGDTLDVGKNIINDSKAAEISFNHLTSGDTIMINVKSGNFVATASHDEYIMGKLYSDTSWTYSVQYVGDYNHDRKINEEDIDLLTNYWGEDTKYELGPCVDGPCQASDVPHLTPDFDDKWNIEDLMAFILMYKWDPNAQLASANSMEDVGKSPSLLFDKNSLKMVLPDYNLPIYHIWFQLDISGSTASFFPADFSSQFDMALNRDFPEENAVQWSLIELDGMDFPLEFVLGSFKGRSQDKQAMEIQYKLTSKGQLISSGSMALNYNPIPNSYTLSQAYPNPFNPRTTIEYALPIDSEMMLSVYDLQGRLLTYLTQGLQPAGYHKVIWDGSQYSSGLYFIRMEIYGSGNSLKFNKIQKIMLVK